MIMTKTIYHRLGKKMSRKKVSGEGRDKEAVKIFDCAVLVRVAFKYNVSPFYCQSLKGVELLFYSDLVDENSGYLISV